MLDAAQASAHQRLIGEMSVADFLQVQRAQLLQPHRARKHHEHAELLSSRMRSDCRSVDNGERVRVNCGSFAVDVTCKGLHALPVQL